MAPGGGDGRRNAEGQQQQANGGSSNGKKHGCVCGFPVCACAGAAAVASAASSADMDRAAVMAAAAATEGQIGAVNDESWVAVDLSDDLSGDGADAGVALEDRPVFRTEKIKGILLHPYRYTYSSICNPSYFISPVPVLSALSSPRRRASALTGLAAGRHTPP